MRLLCAALVVAAAPSLLTAAPPLPDTTTLASAVPTPGRPIPWVAADLPEPPSPDMSELPADTEPSPIPGAEARTTCARTKEFLTAAQAKPLLWGVEFFRLPELWRSAASKGAGVVLAVIDTGVNAHPLLGGRLTGGGDFIARGNGLDDCDGHGTAVAGIAASAWDPATGFSGIAPQVRVLAIRQTSETYRVRGRNPDEPDQGAGDTVTLARAIVHAVDLKADVINLSEVSCLPPPARPTPLQAALHYAVAHNVVVVAAAGNLGNEPCTQQAMGTNVVLPGWYDEDVLTVGAMNQVGIPSQFSYPGAWVDVAAPGEGVPSLSVTGGGITRELQQVRGYSDVQGTSFAAPAVAGLAVLIRAKYPSLTAHQVMDRITATAKTPTRRDPRTGYGVVDPLAALEQQPGILPSPTAAVAGTGTLPRAEIPTPDLAGVPALWGGLLALLAAVVIGLLAVGKSRTGRGNRHRNRR
ncbi:type VII secretion-associated serine protease mycosin [Pseudonocardia spinosispora]|uniref:type VII secretion-associated serine protease mycosin n=1 Tax=Pseudonocardia spinosispora TaxID=103441 RepID=UPI00042A4841|nr:type VII secretion-associated serine protease mycosin [Pseudonocardia spinosispora]